MLHRFHRKITLLYTLTTGIILTLVSKLQSGDVISYSWLSQMEADNDLIIHIEDNGVPLLFRGSWNPLTRRSVLIRRAKEYAAKKHVDTSITPVSSGISQTDIFQVRGDSHDVYHAIVITLPFAGGYKSLVLLSSLQPIHRTIFKQRILFIVLDIVGILALLIVSWYFTGRILKPIRESKEQQDSFITAASHELRSPIAVIQASANAIVANPSEAEHMAGNIMSECDRLSRLVQDLLSLASADTASWSVKLCPTDVDTLLLNVYEAYENVCLEKNISLLLSLPDESLPTILGDRERLLQLLIILIDNAITYSDSGSSINIAAEASRYTMSISVIDHGIGIPDEKKGLVFHRFYRGDKSRNDKSHFGLGLSIATELAKLHKGSLSVKDTVGGGCTFTLKIPLGTGEI